MAWYDPIDLLDNSQSSYRKLNVLLEQFKNFENSKLPFSMSRSNFLIKIVDVCEECLSQPKNSLTKPIISIQKEAVKRLYSPQAENDTKARIQLLRQLFNYGQGKALYHDYWQEYRYGGDDRILSWLRDNDTKYSFADVKSSYIDQYRKIKYNTPSENESQKVNFKSGQLFLNDEILDTTETFNLYNALNGKMLFVMDTKGNLYVSEGSDGLVGFRHSSFFAGSPCLCAGNIKVENGIIKEIDLRSGHYRPGDRYFAKFLKKLEQQDVDLSEAIYRNNKGELIKVSEFIPDDSATSNLQLDM